MIFTLLRDVAQFRRHRARETRDAAARVAICIRSLPKITCTAIDVVAVAVEGVHRAGLQAGLIHACDARGYDRIR